ncbi:MAG TPA: hypothetical protein VK856_13470, partial [Anaerolineaceae bacterium]|nr:hypothetical protein [Anaerolineaceae bacterium]
MKKLTRSLQIFFNLISKPYIFLLVSALLTYGFFIPFLGYYWDDLMIQWISQSMGTAGLATYFSTNRPVWGLFYQLSTSLLGDAPWQWQIFAIFWRWLAAYGLFSLCKQIWKQNTPAILASLIFLTYPGFSQQFIATVYGHFFLVLSAFFFSLTFNLMALKTTEKKRFWILTCVALLLSAVNLFSMEYFFMLELLRPFFMWMVLSQNENSSPCLLKIVVKHWIPYLSLFLLAGFWRAFLFDYQTKNYEVGLVSLLRENPVQTVMKLLGTIFKDIWQILIGVWKLVVQLPGQEFGQRAWMVVLIFTLILLAFVLLVIYWIERQREHLIFKNAYLKSLWISLIAVVLAGIPFWLTSIPIGLAFPNDRFTLPFILGVSIFWISLMMLLPLRRWMQIGIILLAVTLSTAFQLRTGFHFQRDWEQQSRFFWQMAWRIPALDENTIIFAHELPFQYFSDNSLTGGLNWI